MLLFGEEGQHRLRRTSTVIVGAGGLGSPLAQHLALRGVGRVTSADDDKLEDTNRNRFVGARHDDPDGSLKVDLVSRMVREINPDVEAVALPFNLVSEEASRRCAQRTGCSAASITTARGRS